MGGSGGWDGRFGGGGPGWGGSVQVGRFGVVGWGAGGGGGLPLPPLALNLTIPSP